MARFTMSNRETLYDVISDNKAYSANTNSRVANLLNIAYRIFIIVYARIANLRMEVVFMIDIRLSVLYSVSPGSSLLPG